MGVQLGLIRVTGSRVTRDRVQVRIDDGDNVQFRLKVRVGVLARE